MNAEQKTPEIYQTPTFKKAFKKLTETEQDTVDDEIEIIINNPENGEQKKGDLAFLQVHKFMLSKQQVLLGYHWKAEKIELYLLNLSSHENFYRNIKTKRSSILKHIK